MIIAAQRRLSIMILPASPLALQLMLVSASAEAGMGKSAGLDNRRGDFPIRPGTGNRGLPGLPRRASESTARARPGPASFRVRPPSLGSDLSVASTDLRSSWTCRNATGFYLTMPEVRDSSQTPVPSDLWRGPSEHMQSSAIVPMDTERLTDVKLTSGRESSFESGWYRYSRVRLCQVGTRSRGGLTRPLPARVAA
jgi:hypothetical protein